MQFDLKPLASVATAKEIEIASQIEADKRMLWEFPPWIRAKYTKDNPDEMENKNIYNVKMPGEWKRDIGGGKWVEIPQLIAGRWREFPLFELRASFFFAPPFFDKSKTDEFVLDTTLKKLLCAKERAAGQTRVCGGWSLHTHTHTHTYEYIYSKSRVFESLLI